MSLSDCLSTLGLAPVRQLGKGAFGQVFHCTSEQGQDLAVKICTEPNACIAARSEAATMAALPAHPNVMSVSSFHAADGYTVMAMPLATGGDTLKYMQEREGTPLAESEVRSLFTQLIDGVEHMHSNGFVHRDIKCENILLTGPRRRTVVLGDLGFATRYTKGRKALEEAFGSLHYSSPEICQELSYEGPEVDVWSMGVVLYAWASGRLPFGGATHDEIAARIINGTFVMQSRFSPELCELLSNMLSADRSKRATIAEIRKSAWFAPQKPALVPSSTSVVNLSRSIQAELPQHRRRNSEADVMKTKPSGLTRAIKGLFNRK